MLREQAKLVVRLHRLLDVLIVAGAFVSAYFIKLYCLPQGLRGLITAPNYYIVLLLVIIIWYPVFSIHGMYQSYRTQKLSSIHWNTFKASSCGILVLIMAMYAFKITDVSRIMLGIFYGLNLAFLWTSKTIVYQVLKRFRSRGYNFRNVLIVGSGRGAKDIINAIGDRLGAGYRIVGCLERNETYIGMKVKNGVKVIDTYNALERLLMEEVVDELIFATSLRNVPDVRKHIDLAEKMGVTVRILPQWYIRRLGIKPRVGMLRIEEFLGTPTMAINSTPAYKGEIVIKNFIDYTVAAAVLILAFPFWALIAAGIKLSSPGPVLFKQERVGQNRRRFTLYKFRTMAEHAEGNRKNLEALNESDGPVFKIKKDPRVIPYIGTFLRRTSLDELPQLINVLKGELSIVGPRPPLASEVEKYDLWQRRRMSMKPGLTCLWQCARNRNQICFVDWMEMDLKYIDNWSLKLDFKIMAMTVWVVLNGEGR